MEKMVTGKGNKMDLREFYKGKRVLLTGHTGFKGAWLSRILIDAGADVIGYSRGSKKAVSLFELSGEKDEMTHIVGDVRDLEKLMSVFSEYKPELVIHMAAQPIVRDSYLDPVYTYETNVLGTVNILECIRKSGCVRSFLNVTTDKVYRNNEWEWGYRENEELDGYDPYSNSKSCSELVTHTYKRSFFSDADVAISTARAGNVIGGGDFANDRIIPDCIRAMMKNEKIIVRNPYSTRPYQHVLEPLSVYLTIVKRQFEDRSFAGSYNVGPDECDCVTTGALVDLFCQKWGEGAVWTAQSQAGAPHEANFLKLDCSKIKKTFGWKPTWHIDTAIEKTVEWSKAWLGGENVTEVMQKQINEFFGDR